MALKVGGFRLAVVPWLRRGIFPPPIRTRAGIFGGPLDYNPVAMLGPYERQFLFALELEEPTRPTAKRVRFWGNPDMLQ